MIDLRFLPNPLVLLDIASLFQRGAGENPVWWLGTRTDRDVLADAWLPRFISHIALLQKSIHHFVRSHVEDTLEHWLGNLELLGAFS